MRLIPAIDLKDGHCVRLLQGDFARETRYARDPLALRDEYARLGADWLHVVDLDGARQGVAGNRGLIVELARAAAPRVQSGGGLRSAEAVASLLEAGVARAVIGSAAVTQPDEVVQWLQRFGADRLVLAFDVRLGAGGDPKLATYGWLHQSEMSLWELTERYAAHDLLHVLCTDIDRDGALAGPNVALYAEAVRRFPPIQWQASGGIRNAFDLRELADTGVAAAVSGKALLEGRMNSEELGPFLPNA